MGTTDLLHPDVGKTVRGSQERQRQGHDAHARTRDFEIGDLVYARNYAQGPTWLPGKVTGKFGSVFYSITLEYGRTVRKHADHLRCQYASETGDSQDHGNQGHQEAGSGLDLPVLGDPEGGDKAQMVPVPVTPAAEPDSTQTLPVTPAADPNQHSDEADEAQVQPELPAN